MCPRNVTGRCQAEEKLLARVSAEVRTRPVGGRHTNFVRTGVHPAVADAILGHGDKQKSLQSLYLTISDDDLVRAIDMMR